MKIAVSFSAKINVGNYESREVFLSVSDVEPGATESDIEAALDTASLSFEALRHRMKKKLAEVRDGVRDERAARLEEEGYS